jgi:polysaccharide export outer membrane protein
MARAITLLALTLLSACSTYYAKLPSLASDREAAYVLGPADQLQITVYGETDLTGKYRISDTGNLTMPLIGPVPAQGLTVTQLQKALRDRLDAKALKSPDVTLEISEYRPFFILGEVKNPGSYPYVPNMTVLTAVAIAGGSTFRASADQMSITRQQQGASREARAQRDTRVLPGDVVYVFERHF